MVQQWNGNGPLLFFPILAICLIVSHNQIAENFSAIMQQSNFVPFCNTQIWYFFQGTLFWQVKSPQFKQNTVTDKGNLVKKHWISSYFGAFLVLFCIYATIKVLFLGLMQQICNNNCNKAYIPSQCLWRISSMFLGSNSEISKQTNLN